MHFKDKRIQRALSALPTALLVLFLLRAFAETEFILPSDAPLPTEAPSQSVYESADGIISETAPADREQTDALFGTLFTNGHEILSLTAGGSAQYFFTPSRSDSYIFCSFPAENAPPGAVSATLRRISDGHVITQSVHTEGLHLECELSQDEGYRLEITAHDNIQTVLEVMVHARGRCFDNPISLPSESIRYAKTIVRARDVHWFRFTAPVNGRYMIRTEKSGDTTLDTMGYLLNSQGHLLTVSDDILFPGDTNFLIEQELTAGETYYIRINALSNLTGAYRLVLTMPQENAPLPSALTLSHHELVMEVGHEYRLSGAISPADALDEIVYASSNQGVVSVEPDGTLRSVSAGTASIHAIGYNGVQDVCRVEVLPVRVTGLTFEHSEAVLCKGETMHLKPQFSPANATDQRVVYQSSDESVVHVSPTGLLSAAGQGQATVTATSSDGGFTATVQVRVERVRPTYRALVIGEQNYEGDTRIGGENTAQGVADMLRAQSINGASYEVRLQLDSSRRELIEGIREAFDRNAPEDISLIYINAHGAYENGVAYIRLHDDSRITVRQLEMALRSVSGKIVVILDFCQSGAFIGAGGDFERFCADTQTAFGASALTSGRYTVIASAASDQDSYRRAFTTSGGEAGTAAIMGRSLCEGAGWDLIYDRTVSLKADSNRDKLITVQEIYAYTRRRVTHYLEGTGASQTVHIWPEGDQTVIFGRN